MKKQWWLSLAVKKHETQQISIEGWRGGGVSQRWRSSVIEAAEDRQESQNTRGVTGIFVVSELLETCFFEAAKRLVAPPAASFNSKISAQLLILLMDSRHLAKGVSNSKLMKQSTWKNSYSTRRSTLQTFFFFFPTGSLAWSEFKGYLLLSLQTGGKVSLVMWVKSAVAFEESSELWRYISDDSFEA